MKLKTLKDLIPSDKELEEGDHSWECIDWNNLRAEAVKHVKFYEGNNDFAAAGAIGYMFNLEEGDLK